MASFDSLSSLNACLSTCRQCPRLVTFRNSVPQKAKFGNQPYWKKPVSGFGDPHAFLLILGLAPSAQGGNRTGRIFTGDASARFLFQALHQEGFANQPTSESVGDGLTLHGCYLTAAVKCVPPKNQPNASEQKQCLPYLLEEYALLKSLTAVLALGAFAYHTYLNDIARPGGPKAAFRFQHGKKQLLTGFPTLYGSYHPSPQNTQTGKLNLAMLCQVLRQIKADLY